MPLDNLTGAAIRHSRHPYAREGIRRTADRQNRFVAALARGVSVSMAAKAAGVFRTTPYEWRSRDPDFARRWDEAVDAGNDAIYDALRAHVARDWRAGLALLKWRRPEMWDRGRAAINSTVQVAETEPELDRARALELMAKLGLYPAVMGRRAA